MEQGDPMDERTEGAPAAKRARIAAGDHGGGAALPAEDEVAAAEATLAAPPPSFQLELRNLPGKWSRARLDAALLAPALGPLGVAWHVRMHYSGAPRTLLAFDSEADLLAARAALDGRPATEQRTVSAVVLRGVVDRAAVSRARATVSRSAAAAGAGSGSGHRTGNGTGTGAPSAASVVSEWQDVPYEEQLGRKRRALGDVLRRVERAAVREKLPWAAAKGALILGELVASPATERYRNKVEFTVALDPAGARCVGFNLGRFGAGVTAVGDPSGVRALPAGALWVRAVLQAFVERSPLAQYDKVDHSGCWRLLMVRSNLRGEMMVAMQHRREGNDPAVVDEELARLERALFDPDADAGPPRPDGVGVVSLFVQDYAGISNRAPYELPWVLRRGAATLDEVVLGKTFRISPNSFFQINTLAAAELFRRVGDVCALSPEKTTLLDLYSGTGMVGVTLSDRVKSVVGIEQVPDAVDDARRNAALNGLGNTDFRAGLTEELLEGILRAIPDPENCVAVVDPARSGLHTRAVRVLRMTPSLRHLVYISCNQNAFVDDCERLCKLPTRNYGGRPWRPVRAFGVDLFPDTPHVELVVVFTRDAEQEHAPAPAAEVQEEKAAAASTRDGDASASLDP